MSAQARKSWLWLFWVASAVLALVLLLVHSAQAATSEPIGGHTASFTLFDSIDSDAKTQSQGWFSAIQAMVTTTFKILGTIEICWAAAIWAFEKEGLNSLAVEIIKKIMFIGFFFTLLQYAPEWIPTISDSFEAAGEQATGTGPVTTDKIIATGLAVIDFIFGSAPGVTVINVWGLIPKFIVAAFVSVGIIIAYIILAAQYFTLKIESYVLFAAGAIFLGMGSSRWTQEYVTKYLNYTINVGVRLLVLILILSLMLGVVASMAADFSFDYGPLLKILAISLLQGILGIKAPEMAGALLNGGVGLSAGSAMGAATAMAKPVMGAAGNVASKAVSSLQGMGNFGKAVSAGRQIAQSQGKSGSKALAAGLGMAAAEVAKGLPAAVGRAIKGTAANAQPGQNPGVFARANAKLQVKKEDVLSSSTGALSGMSGAFNAAGRSPLAKGATPGGGSAAGGGSGSSSAAGEGGSSAGAASATSPAASASSASQSNAAAAATMALAGAAAGSLASNSASGAASGGSQSNTAGLSGDSVTADAPETDSSLDTSVVSAAPPASPPATSAAARSPAPRPIDLSRQSALRRASVVMPPESSKRT
jgi:type IV secretion system protein TrbL